jgi:hypothetical protein
LKTARLSQPRIHLRWVAAVSQACFAEAEVLVGRWSTKLDLAPSIVSGLRSTGWALLRRRIVAEQEMPVVKMVSRHGPAVRPHDEQIVLAERCLRPLSRARGGATLRTSGGRDVVPSVVGAH